MKIDNFDKLIFNLSFFGFRFFKYFFNFNEYLRKDREEDSQESQYYSSPCQNKRHIRVKF